MRILTSMLVVFLFAASSFAQHTVVPSMDGGRSLPDGTIIVGPDPKNLGELFGLLEDIQIAHELGLGKAELEAVRKIQKRHSDEVVELRKMQISSTGSGLTGAQVMNLRAAHEEDFANSIVEVLPPEDLERLKTIVYRMEIARVGYAKSLTTGFLARDTNVYDDQKSELYRDISEIEREVEEQIRLLRMQAEKRILQKLTPEQRRTATELLGAPFEYKYLTPQQRTQLNLESMQQGKTHANSAPYGGL